MHLNEIRQALRAAGLERLADEAERLTQPAIVFEAQAADEDDLPIGASKFGGRPDLSPDMRWPEHDGRPLGFLAQFNLAEVAPYDMEGVLPRTGLLSFFFDFTAAPWGLRREGRGGWRVTYVEQDSATLARAEWPVALARWYRNPTKRLSFSSAVSLTREPGWAAQVKLSDIEYKRFRRTYSLIRTETRAPSDQLLGYPTLVHYGAMPLACEIATAEELIHLSPLDYDEEAQNEPDKVEDEATKWLLARSFSRWRLLCQFDFDPIFGEEVCKIREPNLVDELDLARGAIVYFWIENDRFAQRDFSNVWLLGASEV